MTAGGRTWLFRLCVAALVLAASEGASAGALWLLELRGIRYEPLETALSEPQRRELTRIVDDEPVYLDHDPELGWSPRPLGVSSLYRANGAGLRADREYPLEPTPGTLRIAAFGDSYVHGDQVTLADTWVRQVESLAPGLEVLNFGVSGYGVDQALLRYQAVGRRYHPRIVLIGFMTDDLSRAVSSFRLFNSHGSSIPLAKPRFVLENGSLRLVPNPFPRRTDYAALLRGDAGALARLGANDAPYQSRYHASRFDFLGSVRVARLAWMRWRGAESKDTLRSDRRGFDTHSEAFALNLALIEAFARAVREDGALPLVVLFPGRLGTAPYAALRQALEERGLPTLDLLTAFNDAARLEAADALFLYGHFSPLGNRVAATALVPRLAALAHGPPRDAVDDSGRQQPHEAAQAAAQR